MVVVLGFLIAAAVALWVAYPLLRGDHLAAEGVISAETDDLIARRATLYREVAELDFDHQTGKLDDADYAVQRAEYVDEAAALLQHIEERAATAAPLSLAGSDLIAEIEEEIRRLRGLGAPNP